MRDGATALVTLKFSGIDESFPCKNVSIFNVLHIATWNHWTEHLESKKDNLQIIYFMF